MPKVIFLIKKVTSNKKFLSLQHERYFEYLYYGRRVALEGSITRQQALQAMTTDVAYQWREEDRQGSILDNVWDAQLKATYVDGKVVYGE